MSKPWALRRAIALVRNARIILMVCGITLVAIAELVIDYCDGPYRGRI